MPSPKRKAVVKSSSQDGRVSIIQAVQSPLGFFTLGLLILEGGLIAATTQVPEKDRTTLFCLCLILIFLTIVGVGFLAFSRSEYLFGKRLSDGQQANQQAPSAPAVQIVPFRHDIFLSSPMAGLPSSTEYEATRKALLELADTFRTECGFENVFYAGRHLHSVKDFEPEGISVKDDLKAIEESRYFVMIYHSKVVTSALFEAGCAVALKKPSLYFIRDEEDLPFLLKQAISAFIDVKMYKSQDISEVIKLVCKHKLKLFGQ